MAPLETQYSQSDPPPQPIQQQYQPPPPPTVIYYPNETNVNSPRLYGAYLLWLPPFGLLGFHHLYMRRIGWFFLYFFTGGLCGVGWLVDVVRIPFIIKRAESEEERKKYHLDEAYVLWFPLGFLGLHQIYLRRWGWAVLYFFTAGLCGLGWIIDMCLIPHLVKQKNKSLERLLPNGQPDAGFPGSSATVVHVHHHHIVPPTGMPANYGTHQPAGMVYPQQNFSVQPTTGVYQVPPPTPAVQSDAPPAYNEKN